MGGGGWSPPPLPLPLRGPWYREGKLTSAGRLCSTKGTMPPLSPSNSVDVANWLDTLMWYFIARLDFLYFITNNWSFSPKCGHCTVTYVCNTGPTDRKANQYSISRTAINHSKPIIDWVLFAVSDTKNSQPIITNCFPELQTTKR